MNAPRPREQRDHFLRKGDLGWVIGHLAEQGYTTVAPVLVDGVVSLRPIQNVDDLTLGVQDEQSPGRYRTQTGGDGQYFQCAVGPDSPKRFLYPPEQLLFGLHVDDKRFVVDAGPPAPPKLAFLGIRPCDLAAMAVQNRVFGTRDPGTFRCESNPYYAQAVQEALLIVVNCTRPNGNCFCGSMGTGPVASEGFDLALTELRDGFIIRVGSSRGEAMIQDAPVREPTSAELELMELRLAQAETSLKRRLDVQGLRELLERHVEHPCWDEVATRCLGCGNCTMVCPTCFCSSVVDANELSRQTATRTRQWESCFTHQFSYTTAGPVRSSIRARYRHWLRHKFCTWHEQFGEAGCIGCGRCITWCPAGIDLIEQLETIRQAGLPAATADSRPMQGIF